MSKPTDRSRLVMIVLLAVAFLLLVREIILNPAALISILLFAALIGLAVKLRELKDR